MYSNEKERRSLFQTLLRFFETFMDCSYSYTEVFLCSKESLSRELSRLITPYWSHTLVFNDTAIPYEFYLSDSIHLPHSDHLDQVPPL